MTRTIAASSFALALLVACPVKDDPNATDGPSPSVPPTSETGTTGTTGVTAATPFDAFVVADLTDPTVIAGLSAASALQLYALHTGIVAEATSSADPLCPLVGDKNGVTTITGGCTAASGVEWFGSAEVVEAKDGTTTLTFSGFGSTRAAPCATLGEITDERRLDGTVSLSSDLSVLTYATSGTFTTLDPIACTAESRSFLLDYAGTTASSGVWAGSGTYGDDRYGRATVETFAQVSGVGSCFSESLTGVTTFATSADHAILLYDGGVDCDVERTAKWLLNGVSQGEVSGVCCASLSDTDADGVQDAVDNCPTMTNGPDTPVGAPDADGWIEDWLTFGPVTGTTSPADCAPSLDELAGGDAQLAPELGDVQDGLTWMAAFRTGTIFGFIADFGFVDPPREVYAHAYVYSASVRDLTLAVGADDGVRAWVEGAMVLDISSCQGVTLDQFQAPVSLAAGWNRLTLKVRDQGGGWGMSVRFLDGGVPVTDLEVALSADGVLEPQSDLDGDGRGDVCDETPAG